jgi:uncharacterized protein (UPF0276 family)
VSAARSPSLLPREAVGLGLRVPHYAQVCEERPSVDYFEVIAENFLGDAPSPRRWLRRVRETYPVVLHGVGLNLLGSEPLDEAYLDALARLADEVDAPFVTDHLCWTGSQGRSHHDLLPTPYVEELIPWAAERIAQAKAHLGRPFGLENLSSYLSFESSTLREWEFYTAVAKAGDCGLLLDVNNVYVSARNHGFEPREYLRALPWERVLQVHLAGHEPLPDGRIVDTHDREVCDEVWELYGEAWALGGPFPTMIEWDASLPPLPRLLEERERVFHARTSRALGERPR